MDELARMQAIIDTQTEINESDPSLIAVMRIVVERAQELTESEGAVVELAEGDEMVYAATSGSVSGHEGVRLSLHGSLSGLCVTTGEPLVCIDSEEDDRVDREACRRVGARSMLVVPLVSKGATVGVLKVVSVERDKFGEADALLLKALGGFIASAISKASQHDETQRLATTDPLTGLENRAAFMEQLRSAVALAERLESAVGVAFIDLDGFKPVNDTYGHEAGDYVLREVAARLMAATRTGEHAARLGGDEFAVITVNDPGSSAAALRDRLEAVISEPIILNGQQLRIGASVGLATTSGSDVAESLLARADAAMYAAKKEKAAARG